jgi:hypothetical protein
MDKASKEAHKPDLDFDSNIALPRWISKTAEREKVSKSFDAVFNYFLSTGALLRRDEHESRAFEAENEALLTGESVTF